MSLKLHSFYLLCIFFIQNIQPKYKICHLCPINDPLDEIEINFEKKTNEPLLISLGDACPVASSIKAYGYRIASFPFDWNVSDFEKIPQLLASDFEHFLSKDFLKPSQLGSFSIYNSLYNFDFAHDFHPPHTMSYVEPSWKESLLENVIKKYNRRIERFRNIKNYKSKVYFIHNNTHNRSNYSYKNISETNDALKKFFPDINFTLIIFNQQKALAENALTLPNVKIINLPEPLGYPHHTHKLSSFFIQSMKKLGIPKKEGSFVVNVSEA